MYLLDNDREYLKIIRILFPNIRQSPFLMKKMTALQILVA